MRAWASVCLCWLQIENNWAKMGVWSCQQYTGGVCGVLWNRKAYMSCSYRNNNGSLRTRETMSTGRACACVFACFPRGGNIHFTHTYTHTQRIYWNASSEPETLNSSTRLASETGMREDQQGRLLNHSPCSQQICVVPHLSCAADRQYRVFAAAAALVEQGTSGGISLCLRCCFLKWVWCLPHQQSLISHLCRIFSLLSSCGFPVTAAAQRSLPASVKKQREIPIF